MDSQNEQENQRHRPQLPDMYTLWMELAHVQHKLEPFARGDRTPAAINQAREALVNLKGAQFELNTTAGFVTEELRLLDGQREQALSDWENEVDRPDLQRPGPGVPQPILQTQEIPGQFPIEFASVADSEPHPIDDREPTPSRYASTDQIAALLEAGQKAARAKGLSEADGVFDRHLDALRDGDICGGCGHPESAHSYQVCETLVADGFSCGCEGFVRTAQVPVFDVQFDKQATLQQFTDAENTLDRAQSTGNCWNCTHPLSHHNVQTGSACSWPHTDTGYPCRCGEALCAPPESIPNRPTIGKLQSVVDEMDNTRTEKVTMRQADQFARDYQTGDKCFQCGHAEGVHTQYSRGGCQVGGCDCEQFVTDTEVEISVATGWVAGVCEDCGHRPGEHKFQGCVSYDTDEGNCFCRQYRSEGYNAQADYEQNLRCNTADGVGFGHDAGYGTLDGEAP